MVPCLQSPARSCSGTAALPPLSAVRRALPSSCWGKGREETASLCPGLASRTSPSGRAASTLKWRGWCWIGPETVRIRERRGNVPGSPWSWRDVREYLFEHCKSKESYVGRKTSVMGNLAREALARSCVLVTFKWFWSNRSVRALGKDDRVACSGKKLLWGARFNPYTNDWQAVLPGSLQK